MQLANIRKALTPIVTGGLGWASLVVLSPSASITAGEWLMGGAILATSLGVYAITNGPVPPLTVSDVTRLPVGLTSYTPGTDSQPAPNAPVAIEVPPAFVAPAEPAPSATP